MVKGILGLTVIALWLQDVSCAVTSTAVIDSCLASGLAVTVTVGGGLTGTPYTYGYKDDAGCAVTGTGPYTITYSDMTSCDITQSGGLYTTVIIVPSLTSGVETASDEIITINCNPADAYSATQSDATGFAGNTGGNEAGSTNATTGDPTLTMSSTLADGSAISGTIDLGTSLKLTITLTDDVSGAYDALKAVSCVATPSSSSADATNAQLIDANGCAVDSTFFGAFTAGTSPNIEATFSAFKFANEANVYLHCAVTVCAVGDGSSCTAGTCTSPDAGLGRKKRSPAEQMSLVRERRQIERASPNAPSEVTKVVSSAIKVVFEEADLAHGNKYSFNTMGHVCVNSTLLFSVGAVLAVILLVAVTVLVVRCVMSKKGNKGGDDDFHLNGGLS